MDVVIFVQRADTPSLAAALPSPIKERIAANRLAALARRAEVFSLKICYYSVHVAA